MRPMLLPSAIASRASGRNSGIVNSHVAPESTIWWRSSRAVYVGLTVVTVPPHTSVPCRAMAYSGMLGERIISTSPGWKPRATRPPAKRCTIICRVP